MGYRGIPTSCIIIICNYLSAASLGGGVLKRVAHDRISS